MIEVKEGFLVLHQRGGVPILVKGNMIVTLSPLQTRKTDDPEMTVIGITDTSFAVLEMSFEIIEAISLSYKQVTRK